MAENWAKWVHLTDLHMVPEGERLHGLDPAARLLACIHHINTHHADALGCILTGDLADRGDLQSYQRLRGLLDELDLPWRLTVGNHDDRANVRSVFPAAFADGGHFAQSVEDTPAGTLILLDSVDAGKDGGRFCAERLAWLDAKLTEYDDDRPVYLFLHHPPFSIGIPCLDGIALANADEFYDVISRRGNVRHLFVGHVHRPIGGSWRGVAFTALASTNHQVPLDMVTREPVPKYNGAPGYGVVLLSPDGVVMHHQDFEAPLT